MEPAEFDERFAAWVLDERDMADARNRMAAIIKKGFAAVCFCLGREFEPDAFEPERASSATMGRGATAGQEAVASPNAAAALVGMMMRPPTG